MKTIFFIFLIASNIFAIDSLVLQKQNTLYTQNLIEKEEEIAKAYEKYLLEKFKIPTMDDLQKNDTKNIYLGTNFSLKNKFGTNLGFFTNDTTKLVYAISLNNQEYIKLLYERDLYRDYTTVYNDKTTPTNSYVEIRLKSKEAENIFKILKSGKTIVETCSDNLTNSYCNLDKKVLRYYDSSGNWIEYSKKDFTNGNVNVSSMDIFNDTYIKSFQQKIGTYAIVKNSERHIKFNDGFLKVK